MENENEKQLIEENKALRVKLEQAEEIISPIRSGGVDAILVSGLKGKQVFTLTGAERAYRILIETMNEGAASLNREGTIIYCNQRLAEMLKTPLEKVIGSPLRQFIKETDHLLFDNLMEKRLQESCKGEVALINNDGSVLPVLLSVSTVQKDNENICGITVTDLTAQKHFEAELRRHRDHLEEQVKDRTSELETANQQLLDEVTERKLSEEALRKSENEFRLLAESMPQIVWITRPDGKYTYFNQQWMDYTGQTLEESYGHGWNKPFHPDDRQRAWDAWQNAIKNHATYSAECRLRRADGAYKWWLVRGVPVLDAQGTVLKWFGTCTDIEDIKQTEAELEQYFNLFQTATDIMVIADPNGAFKKTNPACTEILGYPESELLAKPFIDFVHPDDKQSTLDEMARQQKIGASINFENRYLCKDGSVRTLSWRATNKKDEGMTYAVARDITEHRKLETQLRQSQKMEAIGQLAGGVAHDFNNILSAIFGYSQLSLSKLQENDQVKEYVEQIMKASERAAVLTQSLLAFSRKQEVILAVIDLGNVVSEFEIFLHRLIREDIELKVSCNEGSLAVLADRGQIEQVIMNLVANGRDAMPNGGKLFIETNSVTLDQEFVATHGYGTAGGYAVISIADSGIGMDKETQSHIFEPFYTTKELGKGTGLGLAMAYGIIKKHDGFINVYSEPGRGTIFRIYLPLVADVTRTENTIPESAAVPRGDTETILVCEDDEVLRKLAAKVFSHFGYRVIEAIDGQYAVEKFVAHKDNIDLVVIDAIMPKKNGKEASEEMKIARPDIKTIFVSGYSREIFDEDSPFDLNTIFIHKPYSPNELLIKTREMLDKNSQD